MMPTERMVPLGDVLRFTTGKLVSRRVMDGVQRLADFMVGGSVFTHQIVLIQPLVAADILSQHPRLRDAVPPWGDEETVTEGFVFDWLDAMEARFGALIRLRPMTDPPNVLNPVADLVEMFWRDPVLPALGPDRPAIGGR